MKLKLIRKQEQNTALRFVQEDIRKSALITIQFKIYKL